MKSGVMLASASAAFVSPIDLLGQDTNRSETLNSDRELFFKSVAAGDRETVSRVLDAEPGLRDAKNDNGLSGYSVALLAGHRPIAEFLVEKGYQSDLHESALALDWKRFEKLAEDADAGVVELANKYHDIGGTAMYAAAVGGAGTDTWRVFAKCCSPNVIPKKSTSTPLQKALRFRDLETAELTAFSLLTNAADPNASASGDASPLHIATERGSVDIVEMLIRLGADVGSKDRNGRTSLEVALAGDNKPVTTLLQKHKEIPRTHRSVRTLCDRQGKAYKEPAWGKVSEMKRGRFVGLSHGNLDGIKEMLWQDPRFVHSVATTGERAVEAGAHMGNKPIVELLLEAGAPYSLPTAVMMGDIATAKQYLDADPGRIHERGAHDFALLWYPVIGRCEPSMLELLLGRGADVERQNVMGTTALHFACMRDNVDAVKLLLENGANVKRVGRKFGKKETPLSLSRDSKIIDMLKSKGA